MQTFSYLILSHQYSGDLYNILSSQEQERKENEDSCSHLQITRGWLGGCYVSNNNPRSPGTIAFDALIGKFFKLEDVIRFTRKELPHDLYIMNATVDILTQLTGRVNVEIEKAPRIWKLINFIREIVLHCLKYKNYRSGRELNTFADKLSWGTLVRTFGKELIEADNKVDFDTTPIDNCRLTVTHRRTEFNRLLTPAQRNAILALEISKIPRDNPEFFVYFIKDILNSEDYQDTILQNWPENLNRAKLIQLFLGENAIFSMDDKGPKYHQYNLAYRDLISLHNKFLARNKRFDEIAATINAPICRADDTKLDRFSNFHRDVQHDLSYEEAQQIGKLCGINVHKWSDDELRLTLSET